MCEDVHEGLYGRCATCGYWLGDKDLSASMYKNDSQSMDLFKGYPNDGDCDVRYEWLNVDVSGFCDITTDANFGCVYWKAVT